MNDAEYTDEATRWVTPAGQELHWEVFNGHHAVYDARSGDTHLLAEPTAQVLRWLLVHPGTVSEITEDLCGESGEHCDENSLARYARLLRELHSVGLIEKAGT